MSSSKLKQIKQIVRDHDVRDPNGAMLAIEKVIKGSIFEPKKEKPVFSIRVFNQGPVIKVSLDGIKKVKPVHVIAAQNAIKDFVAEKIAEGKDDCDCPKCVARRAVEASNKQNAEKPIADFAEFIDSLTAAGLNPIVLDNDEGGAK